MWSTIQCFYQKNIYDAKVHGETNHKNNKIIKIMGMNGKDRIEEVIQHTTCHRTNLHTI